MPESITDEQRSNIQFRHPEKALSQLPGTSQENMARLHGVPSEVYEQQRRAFAEAAREAAEDLMEDPELAERLTTCAVEDGQTVVGLGDSITDDLQSWFEILRRCFAIVRPDEAITCRNRGYSGDTTVHAISRFGDVVNDQPDWIICMLSTNDVRLHGQSPTKCLVSAEETEKNFEMLHHYGATQIDARWLWITPGPVIEKKVELGWGNGNPRLMWRNDDIDRVCDALRNRNEPLVDLHETFNTPPDPVYLQPDGLHPSLKGQQEIARAVIETLVELENGEAS